jgi:hypothetical protein
LSDRVNTAMQLREKGHRSKTKGKERGTAIRFRQDLMRFAGAVNAHIILDLPPAGHPSTLVSAHSLDRSAGAFSSLWLPRLLRLPVTIQ